MTVVGSGKDLLKYCKNDLANNQTPVLILANFISKGNFYKYYHNTWNLGV